MTADEFDKKYSYNVKHSYGQEGVKKDYTPYSCSRMFNDTPGSG